MEQDNARPLSVTLHQLSNYLDEAHSLFGRTCEEFEAGHLKEINMAQPMVDASDVRRLFGDISDKRVADILATGATHADLEEVAAWLAQQDDVMGELERSLTGLAAQVYEIVASDPRLIDENDAPR